VAGLAPPNKKAFLTLVKYGFVSQPADGKQTFVPRLLAKRYKQLSKTKVN
jgi:hypothetical protein